MTLAEGIDRDYAESPLVKLARQIYPDIPDDVWRGLFANGYAMGSLHGFVEARATVEQTLMEYAHGASH